MKTVILDGSNGNERLAEAALSALRQRLHLVNEFTLREMEISHCLGCFGCWVKTPGKCVIADQGRDIARAVAQCELQVWLTPVTFGGYSSQLKAAVDRLIPNILPFMVSINGETHHPKRYKRYANLLVVGLMNEAHEPSQQLLRQLVDRNAINLHSPLHATGIINASQQSEIPDLIADMLRKVGLK